MMQLITKNQPVCCDMRDSGFVILFIMSWLSMIGSVGKDVVSEQADEAKKECP